MSNLGRAALQFKLGRSGKPTRGCHSHSVAMSLICRKSVLARYTVPASVALAVEKGQFTESMLWLCSLVTCRGCT